VVLASAKWFSTNNLWARGFQLRVESVDEPVPYRYASVTQRA